MGEARDTTRTAAADYRPHGYRHPRAVHGRRAEGQVGPSGHAHGHGRRGDRAVLRGPALRRRRIRPGPTATASCCRPATAPCCSTRCSICTGYPEMDAAISSRLPPARLQDCRPPRARPCALASRPPPARWAQGSATPWAWRSPSACSMPATATRSWSITTPSASPATAASMEGISQEAISLAGHLEARQAHRAAGTTTRSPSTARPSLSVSDDQVKRFEASGWNTHPRRRP